MAIGLTRNRAPPLLRTVNGKPHARDNDHEDTAPKKNTLVQDKEEDWAREPESSSDETEKSASKPTKDDGESEKTTKDKDGANNHGTIRKSKSLESGMLSGSSSTGKRASNSWDDGADPFFNQMNRSAKKRRTFGATTNIYAPPAKTKITYGAKKFGAAGAKASVSSSSAKKTFGKAGRSDPAPAQEPEDDLSDLSEVSMKSLPTPKKKKTKKTEASPKKAKESPKKIEAGVSKAGVRKSPRGKGKIVHYPSTSTSSSSSSLLKKSLSKSKKSPAKPRAPDLLAKLSSYGDLPPKAPSSSAGSSMKDPNLDPYDSGTSTPLSSLATNVTLSDSEGEDMSPRATCPLCHETIDPTHLETFALSHPRMNVVDQGVFCREHKRRKAQKEYSHRGYPEIDWSTFPTRIEKHYPHLLSILKNTTPSTFRTALTAKVQRGEDRTLLSTLTTKDFATNSSTTGYYGSRGARVMMECITEKFADVIREVAVKDQVVSFGGIGNFVQRVLVPELSLRLVMEDLGVGEMEAREVVGESGEVGELVNEEVDDEVRGSMNGEESEEEG